MNSNAEFASSMDAELIFAPEAEQDLAEAYNWYEGCRPGLVEDLGLLSVELKRKNHECP